MIIFLSALISGFYLGLVALGDFYLGSMLSKPKIAMSLLFGNVEILVFRLPSSPALQLSPTKLLNENEGSVDAYVQSALLLTTILFAKCAFCWGALK